MFNVEQSDRRSASALIWPTKGRVDMFGRSEKEDVPTLHSVIKQVLKLLDQDKLDFRVQGLTVVSDFYPERGAQAAEGNTAFGDR
jgi:hypothetical protein